MCDQNIVINCFILKQWQRSDYYMGKSVFYGEHERLLDLYERLEIFTGDTRQHTDLSKQKSNLNWRPKPSNNNNI